MSVCNSPGPEGLRCNWQPHDGAHSHGLADGAWVQWYLDRRGAPVAVRIMPGPIRRGLAALGTVLREIGDAARGGA